MEIEKELQRFIEGTAPFNPADVADISTKLEVTTFLGYDPTAIPTRRFTKIPYKSLKISFVGSYTYAELVALQTANRLIAGGAYILSDFQTIYDRPDFDDDGLGNITPKLVIETITADIEILVLTATTANTFDKRVLSFSEQFDEIDYDIDYNTTYVNEAPAKGRITYRKDFLGNSADFDIKSVTFKRYDRAADEVFINIGDTGTDDYILLPMINGTCIENTFGNCVSYLEFNNQPFNLPNNVFEDAAYFNSFGVSCINNHFMANLENNICRSDFSHNITYSGFNYNNFTGQTYYNIFNENFTQNTIGLFCTHNEFPAEYKHNKCSIQNFSSVDLSLYAVLLGETTTEIVKDSAGAYFIVFCTAGATVYTPII